MAALQDVAPAWLGDLKHFLHLAPDASALTLGLIITSVLVWSLLCLREHRVLTAWMGWWLACSLFQYSSAGEKVPWLAIHIVLPLYLTVIWLWAPRLRRAGRNGNGMAIGMVAACFVIGASLLALRNDIPLIGSSSADPAERIIYNHTTPWLHRALADRVARWETMQGAVPRSNAGWCWWGTACGRPSGTCGMSVISWSTRTSSSSARQRAPT